MFQNVNFLSHNIDDSITAIRPKIDTVFAENNFCFSKICLGNPSPFFGGMSKFSAYAMIKPKLWFCHRMSANKFFPEGVEVRPVVPNMNTYIGYSLYISFSWHLALTSTLL
jgi:hypothetical protein